MNSKIKWDGKLSQAIEMTIDILLVVSSYILSAMVISNLPLRSLFVDSAFRRDLIITSIALAVSVYVMFRVYGISISKRNYLSVMFRIAISLGLISFILFFSSIFAIKSALPKESLLLMIFLQLLVFALIKGFFYIILKRVNVKSALIIGPREEVHTLTKKILVDDNKYVHPRYLIYNDIKLNYKKIFSLIDSIDNVYITENLDSVHKNTIISYCFKTNKSFYLVPKLYELSINNAKFDQASDTMLYEIKSFGLTVEQRFIKRTFDLILSLVLLILTFPLLIVIAILIKAHDGGPVLFKQERITRNNKKFILYKFRTMIVDAEAKTGPVFATDKDERITKIGKFLRATRIDELPQLFNIIKGEMSIVGPRPERDFFIQEFMKENNDYQYRLQVKAGVTGLAQAMGTYHTEFSEKLRFDIYYITNYSFFKDIKIILHTIRSIFDPRSSQGVGEEVSLEKALEEGNYFIFNTEEPNIQIIVKK